MIKRWHVLSKLIKEKGYLVGVEFGVKSGQNIAEILSNCPGTVMHAVDPWTRLEGYQGWTKAQVQMSERNFNNVFAKYPDRIFKYKEFSYEFIEHFNQKVDFVFIDADHSYEGCAQDITLASRIVRNGGLLAGHDYHHPRFPGVTQAVDERFDNVNSGADHTWWVYV